jgi:hypothetical protein
MGVVLCEIHTMGGTPFVIDGLFSQALDDSRYAGMSNAEVCELVNAGGMMKAPTNCPDDW